MALQQLRSSTANKRPTAAAMSDGQLAVNTNATNPGLFFKDADGSVRKVGPVFIGSSAPNSSPASGGSTGHAVGEQWLDNTGGTYVLKIWDGTAWRSESGTFVDVSGDTMTGALGVVAGSASAPGVFFSGDTNTGLLAPAADSVAITTGGLQRIVVDSSGRLGVGTTSPDSLLDLEFANSRIRFEQESGSNRPVIRGTRTSDKANRAISIGGSDISFLIGSTATTALTSADEKVRIDSFGRLLVGTSTSPTVSNGNLSKIVVQGNTSSTTGGAVLSLQRGQSAGSISSGAGLGLISFGDNAGNAYASIQAFSDGTGGSNDYPGRIVFNTTADSASSTTERMRIDSSGRLGVGTSSPDALLQVGTLESSGNSRGGIAVKTAGSLGTFAESAIYIEESSGGEGFYMGVNSDGGLFFSNSGITTPLFIGDDDKVGIGLTSPEALVHIQGTSSGGRLDCLRMTNNTATAGSETAIIFENTTGTFEHASIVATREGSGTLNFEVAENEAMRISSAGNVGIGRTSPAQNLDVASTSNIAYALDGWALAGKGDSSDILFGGIVGSQFDTLKVYTSGSEQMRIDSSGNVGIGRVPVDNTAGYNLQLRSATTQTYLQLSTSNHGDTLGDGLVIGIDNNTANIVQRENAPLTFFYK